MKFNMPMGYFLTPALTALGNAGMPAEEAPRHLKAFV